MIFLFLKLAKKGKAKNSYLGLLEHMIRAHRKAPLVLTREPRMLDVKGRKILIVGFAEPFPLFIWPLTIIPWTLWGLSVVIKAWVKFRILAWPTTAKSFMEVLLDAKKE